MFGKSIFPLQGHPAWEGEGDATGVCVNRQDAGVS